MNGYEIIVHTPTYHNDHFIGNIPSYRTVHANSLTEAGGMVDLKAGTEHRVHDELVLRQDDQIIYSVRLLGEAVTKVTTEYVLRR